ncbi:SBBP repeat-containing protein [Hymenobacter sp. YC55]|uniref:SBBP repeat-containing protein n=1 Tax=Hymenobacter sp. YC55 TaxID=3034019 RepID=UPI0023F93963|nr:SBBP repeat-containing protein [Hymenobacter sp. YC55]MDF7812054.1 SBBP repeat-containing protein [Hymenobacter sp. YC55]
MKHLFTRLLPAAAGVLLSVPVSQAQVYQPQAAGRATRALPTQIQNLLLPLGPPALQHALPGTKREVGTSKIAKKLERPVVRRDEVSAVGAKTSGVVDGPVSEEWVARYAGPGNSYDAATDVTVDAAGNTYVTGYSFGSITRYDYLTIKYSPNGQKLWQARYDGPNYPGVGDDDVPASIAVDAAGNVLVTGYSYNANGRTYDYLTVKYSPSGQQLWTARYNINNKEDVATDVAVDRSGNVYVTGTSNSSGSSYDYVTLKYTPSGNQLWQARYNNTGTSDEVPTNLVVDATGNVVVTGTTSTANQSDYATIKYSTTGVQQWQALYNGPANSWDLARDLAVDASGNVAVTGTSDDGTGNYDYATVRYSTSGQQLWAARYNGAGNSYDEATSVAVDATGTVAVTGYADIGGGNWDYVTLKYAGASGQQLWEARYNGPANSYDEARDIVVDGSGNVTVTGRSYNSSGTSDFSTVKYSNSGQQLWASRYHGTRLGDDAPAAITGDASGNVFVVGASSGEGFNDTNYTTIRYNASGQRVWEASFNEYISSYYEAADMVVDATGNVYVTGRNLESNNRYDYVTIKYSASGQQLWVARYNGPANGSDNPTAIALDKANNVVVTGSSEGSGSGYDYATIKYSTDGQQLWIARYNGGGNQNDLASSIAVDAAGNVVVTGTSFKATDDGDYATLKYDGTNGQQLWESRYNGPDNRTERAISLAVDAAGNVAVTGNSYRIISPGILEHDAYATVKYDANSGQQLWVTRYTSAVSGYGNVNDIVIDAAGNVYVTGTSSTGRLSSSFTTLKYSASGEQMWVAYYAGNGPGIIENEATKIAVDAAGNVVVAGYTYNYDQTTYSGHDYATVKYSPNGQQLWEARYNGEGSNNDDVKDLVLDANGNVYITGTITRFLYPDYNIVTIKYAGASGQQEWQASYDAGGDYAAALAVDVAGNVYVAGSSSGSYTTIKYNQAGGSASTAPVRTISSPLAVAASKRGAQELSVYPNPTAGPTTISFRPVQDGAAQVRVYNQLGQQVASLYEGKVRQGQHYELPLHSEKLSAGLYTCSLLVNGQREAVRLVVTH